MAMHGFTISIPVRLFPIFWQLLLKKGKVSSKSLFRIEHPSEHRVQVGHGNYNYFTSFLNNFQIKY